MSVMGEQQRPGTLKTKSGELILEKFFNEYITVWFREHTVSSNQYDKARKEIELLKKRKYKKMKDKNIECTNEDKAAVNQLPGSSQCLIDDATPPMFGKHKELSSNAENQKKTDGSKTEETRYIQSLELKNEMLAQKVTQLNNKISNIRANAHCELIEKDDQIEKLKTLLQNSRGQNDDLSKRLSKLAGDKLRQGNPDLADLSDRHRPTEVGKMFSEVYDNEWSDAFENMPKMEEDKKVGILHGIVIKAFKFCDEKFNEQTEMVRTTLLGLKQGLEENEELSQDPRATEGGKTCTSIRTNIQNVLKEIRKEVAIETSENVANEFNMTLQQYVFGFGLKQGEINKSLRKFACKCIELCWLMVICDPPMALSEDKMDKPYDTNIYKPYTKSLRNLKDPIVALPVWPALRLHLDGPLVAKGVAQPGEGKSKK